MVKDHATEQRPMRLSEEEWRERARAMLRVELARVNITYEELAHRLRDLGAEETESSIRNKISRGTFPATFLLQCLSALGVELAPSVQFRYYGEGRLPPGFEGAQRKRDG